MPVAAETVTFRQLESLRAADAVVGSRSEPFALCRPMSSLFHLLLDHATECEQPLVNRGRYLTDEFDHTPPVLKNPRFPNQLIA